MNEQKICFIICYNNELYLSECIRYLNYLEIPDGFELDLLTIAQAESMTAGYNAAMQASDAKYKVYLHQDVFVLYRGFLKDTIALFLKHPEIGMIGMVGTLKMPQSAVMWETNDRIGALRSCHLNTVDDFFDHEHDKEAVYTQVEAVDGLLMMTQYDVPWREDLFDGWDFYDASQSYEFRNKGYYVVVPCQEAPWVLHDCGFLNFQNYEKYRALFCKEYHSTLVESKEQQTENAAVQRIENLIIAQLDQGNLDFAKEMVYQHIKKMQSSELFVVLYLLFQIQDREKAAGESDLFACIEPVNSTTIKEHFMKLKFCVRRLEYSLSDEDCKEAIAYLEEKKISSICVEKIIELACVEKEKAIENVFRYGKHYREKAVHNTHFVC